MSERTRERLIELAAAFRDAIERADRATLGITFQSFPRGSCGDASLLLGHFLREQGFADVSYVMGVRGQGNVDWTSHAWLRVAGYIVDITADQFPEAGQRVIVVQASGWHGTFEIGDEHDGDFAIYDAATIANLGRSYKVIIGGLG